MKLNTGLKRDYDKCDYRIKYSIVDGKFKVDEVEEISLRKQLDELRGEKNV